LCDFRKKYFRFEKKSIVSGAVIKTKEVNTLLKYLDPPTPAMLHYLIVMIHAPF